MALFNRFFNPGKKATTNRELKFKIPSSAEEGGIQEEEDPKYYEASSLSKEEPRWVPLLHDGGTISTTTTEESSSSVRILLIRESDRKGKKVIFDSASCRRVKISKEEEELENLGSSEKTEYEQIYENYGYKYTRPVRKDVKKLGELIMGSYALAYRGQNFKIHHLDGDNQEIMWSTIFKSSDIPRPQKSSNHSNHSLNSSFGSCVSSFHEESFPSIPPEAEFDSGVFPGPSSVDFQLVFGDENRSSNAGLANWGSFCGLKRRYLSSHESSGKFGGGSGRTVPSPVFKSFTTSSSSPISSSPFLKPLLNSPNVLRRQRSPFKDSSFFSSSSSSSSSNKPVISFGTSSLSTESRSFRTDSSTSFSSTFGQQPTVVQTSKCLDLPKPTTHNTKSNTTLAIGVIIKCPRGGKSNELLEENYFMDEVLHHVRLATAKAYTKRQEFVHIMYITAEETDRKVKSFFEAPRLDVTAWHTLTTEGKNYVKLEYFVKTLVRLKNGLDLKTNNFFLSTFLTGILTHQVGWVSTVMASDQRSNESIFQKAETIMGPYGEDPESLSSFWYDPQRVQYMDLHGMIGLPRNTATKSLIISKNEEILKELLFVTSYFIRCSSVLPLKVSFPKDEDEDLISGIKELLIESDFKLDEDPVLDAKKFFGESSSSTSSKFKLGDDSPSPPSSVKFTLGNEASAASAVQCDKTEEETSSASGKTQTEAAAGSIHLGQEVPLPQCLLEEEKYYSRLPSMITYGNYWMPGSYLQGCHISDSEKIRESLPEELSTSLASYWTSPTTTEEVLCVVGDVNKQEVDIISSNQLHGRSGSPVNMAPLVANMMDSVVAVAPFGVPVVLMHIEDKLKDIYLQSCALTEHLLHSTDLITMDTLATNLDIDIHDIPLLLSVASTHTPELTKKYGISFL